MASVPIGCLFSTASFYVPVSRSFKINIANSISWFGTGVSDSWTRSGRLLSYRSISKEEDAFVEFMDRHINLMEWIPKIWEI